MGILANIFKKKDKGKAIQDKTNYTFITSNGQRKISKPAYDNYLVRKSVNKVAELVASTQLKHTALDDKKQIIEDEKSDLVWVLKHQANSRLTSFLFFKQMVARMLLYNDSFAWINIDSFTGKIKELVPIVTSNYALLTPKESPDSLYIDFTLKDGVHKILPVDQILHFTNDFAEGEYFGDNSVPLINVASINEDLWNNLVIWTKGNNSIKGFLKTDSILSREDEERAKQDFSDLLKANDSAYMTLDGKFDYIPASDKSSPMDVNYISRIESTALMFFNISSKILTGEATIAEVESFHKLCLEPIYSMIESELESKFLTKKEILGFGHRIRFVCNNFEHMSPSEKTSAYTLLTNTGVITGNELREGFGFNRIEGLDNFMYSKNFAQVGKTDETSEVDDENKPPKEEPEEEEEPTIKEKEEDEDAKNKPTNSEKN